MIITTEKVSAMEVGAIMRSMKNRSKCKRKEKEMKEKVE